MAVLVESVDVPFERGLKVRALRYADGSYRFRLHEAGPMTLSEAFMGGKDKHVILKLMPFHNKPSTMNRVEELMPWDQFNRFIDQMASQLDEIGQAEWSLGTAPTSTGVGKLVPAIADALSERFVKEVDYRLTSTGPGLDSIIAVYYIKGEPPTLKPGRYSKPGGKAHVLIHDDGSAEYVNSRGESEGISPEKAQKSIRAGMSSWSPARKSSD